MLNEIPNPYSGWNYRVIKHIRNDSIVGEWISFAIHEVYYSLQNEPVAWSEERIAPHGESLEELQEDMKFFQQAFTRPTLQLKNDIMTEVK